MQTKCKHAPRHSAPQSRLRPDAIPSNRAESSNPNDTPHHPQNGLRNRRSGVRISQGALTTTHQNAPFAGVLVLQGSARSPPRTTANQWLRDLIVILAGFADSLC